jgi:histidinol-phosphate/aromatic aminotransferase/cobyric acid decarboxylase-like protein
MNISANWMYFFAILGGLLAAFRIWQNLQKLRRQRNDSWDKRLIDQLRKRGSDPFKPHDVDFFLAFPTQGAAEDLAKQLRTEGFDADVVDEPESGALRWSLHAHKSMQLTVPDMQELSRRLSEAATAKQGRYDGWSAKQVPRPDDIADRMR